MKRITTDWLKGANGPKMIYSSQDRLSLTYIPVDEYQFMKTEFKEDIDGAGIYLLLGINDKGKVAYVGETDKMIQRINYHLKDEKKNFVEEIILIKSQNKMFEITKDQMHYLERNIIAKLNVSDYIVENKNAGQGKNLTKNDEILLDEEIEYIETGLNSLGVAINEEIIKKSNSTTTTQYRLEPIEVYAYLRKTMNKIYGRLEIDNSLTIYKNQNFKNSSQGGSTSNGHVRTVMNRMVDRTTIEINGDINNYEVNFVEDTTFSSPSSAGILIRGGTNSGWTTWKIKSNNKDIDVLRNK